MIKLYFTLKVLIPIIVIIIFISIVLALYIKHKMDCKFKKNCYECNNYKLIDVASCGGGCRYKCSLNDRYDYNQIGDKLNLVKCDKFEQK